MVCLFDYFIRADFPKMILILAPFLSSKSFAPIPAISK